MSNLEKWAVRSFRRFSRKRLFTAWTSLASGLYLHQRPSRLWKNEPGQQLHQRPQMTCLWYQVDVGDTDVASFFITWHRSKGATPGRRKLLPLLTPEYLMGGMRTSTFRFFAELYGRLLHKRQTQKKEETRQRQAQEKESCSPVLRVSSSRTQFIIVLDNYRKSRMNRLSKSSHKRTLSGS